MFVVSCAKLTTAQWVILRQKGQKEMLLKANFKLQRKCEKVNNIKIGQKSPIFLHHSSYKIAHWTKYQKYSQAHALIVWNLLRVTFFTWHEFVKSTRTRLVFYSLKKNNMIYTSANGPQSVNDKIPDRKCYPN